MSRPKLSCHQILDQVASYVQHREDCGCVHEAACAGRAVEPVEPDCTCGLSDLFTAEAKSRAIITAVQALGKWLRHRNGCAVYRPGLDVDPDETRCTCGLADEWNRRHFPLGALAQAMEEILYLRLIPAKRLLQALPPWWNFTVRSVIGLQEEVRELEARLREVKA